MIFLSNRFQTTCGSISIQRKIPSNMATRSLDKLKNIFVYCLYFLYVNQQNKYEILFFQHLVNEILFQFSFTQRLFLFVNTSFISCINKMLVFFQFILLDGIGRKKVIFVSVIICVYRNNYKLVVTCFWINDYNI